MQTSRDERMIVPGVEIEPAYSKAIAQTTQHYNVMVEFVKAQMKRDVDYGVIPGTREPTLLKPGSEKLCRLFNLRPHLELLNSVVDFEKPLFHYHYRCSLYRGEEMVGEADGCCNSREKKYEKQQYKIYDLTNTICCLGARSLGESPTKRDKETSPGSHRKIAQKRALVAAVLCSCAASEFFTQDLEN